MSNTPIRAAYFKLLKRGRLKPNSSQELLVERLSRLQKTLSEHGTSYAGGGLYVHGNVGTGKSRLIDLFANTMPSNITRRRVHFHEFMVEIHSKLHQARSMVSASGNNDALSKIGLEIRQSSTVLCFDEFQVTDIADAMILKRLFESIWDSGGVMVATSNQPPDSLYKNGLNRDLFIPFIEELKQRCEVWKMGGDLDYRMPSESNGNGRMPIFYTDKKKYLAALSSATNNQKLAPINVPVMMNRELSVLASDVDDKSGRRVVDTSFKFLCESAMGSTDYHALCQAASTVFISGLRQFKTDELDFVRRFVTLVDIAYESNTRLICWANIPPEELFVKITSLQDQNLDGKQSTIQKALRVMREGGSSSSMMSTFIGDVEWSATGLKTASLASGGAGETDVAFAVKRAVSRLFEMGAKSYGVPD